MTGLKLTIQETSPLITYSGWVEGNHTEDDLSQNYSGGSFRATNTDGATASFSFTGTAIALFGAKRANHGQYTVKLDQQPIFQASGVAPNGGPANQFNQTLWNADNLEYKRHVVVLTNKPTSAANPWLDLDHIDITRQIGGDGARIFQTIIDDSATAEVKYSGNWEATTGNPTAHQGTLHSTSDANAQVTVTFQGCCIELYGEYANAPYSVSVDNQAPVNLAGLDEDLNAEYVHPNTLLYLLDGLSEGEHNVTLTNLNKNVKRPFSFDNAVISSTQNHKTNTVPTGAIVGAAVGGSIVLIGLGVLLLVWTRRRRRNNTSSVREIIETPPERFIVPYRYDPSSQESQTAHQATGSYGSSSKLRQITEAYTSPSAGSSSSTQAQSSSSGPSSSAGGPATQQSGMSQEDSSQQMSRREARPNVSRPVVQEVDAGVTILPDEQPTATLPPAYNPGWNPR